MHNVDRFDLACEVEPALRFAALLHRYDYETLRGYRLYLRPPRIETDFLLEPLFLHLSKKLEYGTEVPALIDQKDYNTELLN